MLVALVVSPASQAAGKKQTPVVGQVQTTNYLGWEQSFVLTGSALRTVVVPQAGGRILEYSINDENVLLPPPDAASAPVLGERKAGYHCTIGPDPGGTASLAPLWTNPSRATPLGRFGVKLTSEPQAQLGIQLEKEVLMEPESGDLGLTQRLRNTSKAERAIWLCDHTTCPGGGFAFFPLKKKSRFPAGWSLQSLADGKTTWDGAKPQSPHVRILNGVLVANSAGEPTTLGADSDSGWIAYVRGKWLFVKYFSYTAKGRYPEGGHSVRVSFDEQSAELQAFSPEIKLKPGENYEMPEKWTLLELDDRVTSFDEVSALVKRIPPSPFD